MNYKYNEKTCVHLWAGSPFCEIKSKNETIYAVHHFSVICLTGE